MAIACLAVFRRCQLLEGELADGLEDPEARLAIGARRDRQEVVVGQAAERIEQLVTRTCRRHRFGAVEGEAADKDTAGTEHPPVVI